MELEQERRNAVKAEGRSRKGELAHCSAAGTVVVSPASGRVLCTKWAPLAGGGGSTWVTGWECAICQLGAGPYMIGES